MQKILLLFLFCISQVLYGQKPEYIQIEPGGVQIQRSVFSDVEVIDTRFDTVYMGFVQKGAFNRKAPVKLSQSMEAELSGVASKLIAGSDRENGTVLINIRNFFLSELTGAVSESGTFIFKAGCYLKENGRYRPMFSVDTIITVRSGLDITKKLLRTANEQVGLLVQKAASFDVAALDPTIAYSLHDIVHIDELEKKLIPVYNTDLPQKGLYASYEDFKHNRPTTTGFIEAVNKKTNQPSFYQLKEDGTKGKELQREDYYAICNGRQLFISTEYGLYPVSKKGLDFHFVGKAKETANTASVAMASFMFGILGGMLAATPSKASFEFRIDHCTGKFLPLRKISD